MLDPNLQVTIAVTGLTQPIGVVFLAAIIDMLVLEKASGQVKRVLNGVVQPTPVLDLAVNSNSERGLLSMVLHPNFPATPDVFIRWTESTTGADSGGGGRRAAGGQSRGSLCLEWLDSDPRGAGGCVARPTDRQRPRARSSRARPTATRTAITTAG